jgi:hypothetical protein
MEWQIPSKELSKSRHVLFLDSETGLPGQYQQIDFSGGLAACSFCYSG